MTNSCSIEHPHGAIALGSPLLWVEWVISWAEQGPIRLQSAHLLRRSPWCRMGVPIEQAHRSRVQPPEGVQSPWEYANSVKRIVVGNACCPNCKRRFQSHWFRICQTSCPQGV